MAVSRSNTPASNIRPPLSKSTLTIEEWEAKAPLGDAETKSVAVLKAANERRPDLQPLTVKVRCLHYVNLRRPLKSLIVFTRESCYRITPVDSPTTRQTRTRLASFYSKFAPTSSSLCACPSSEAARPDARAVLRLVCAD